MVALCIEDEIEEDCSVQFQCISYFCFGLGSQAFLCSGLLALQMQFQM